MSPIDLKKGKTPKITLLILVALLVAGYVVASRSRHQDSETLKTATAQEVATPKTVTTYSVELGQARESVQLPGSASALYESPLYSRVNGYVDKWYVDIGDRVKKGQVMALISTPELDADLNSAKAKLVADQAEVQVKKAQRDFAKVNYERWRDSPKGVVADQERDAKKADFESASAQVEVAEARVTQDRAEIARLVTLTEFKSVLAPFDGVVTERKVDLGQLVTAGSSSSTPSLFRVADDSQLRIFVDVPQAMANSVRPGIEARVVLGGPTGAQVVSKVTRTSHAVDGASRTLRAEIDIPNAGKGVNSGIYVQVVLKVALPPEPQVPAAAIQFKEGGARVALIGTDHKVHFQPIKISEDLGEWIRVAEGVKTGDLVALNINSQIAEGDQVALEGK